MMIKKTKVLIQLVWINLILSGVFCDVGELKLSSSTTENYAVTPTSNNQNLNYDTLNTDNSGNPLVNSRISLYDVNDKSQNYQLPQDRPSPRLGISNGIITNEYYTNNGCAQNRNIRCIISNGIIGSGYRNPYNPSIVQDRPILDATGGYPGYNYQQPNNNNNQYQPNNVGAAIYTKPSYYYTGNLGQNTYNRPSVIDKPIYQYNGNIGQNVLGQPNRCCIGSNIDQQVINRPSRCCYNGNIGQQVITQPGYYPSPNNDNVYNKPCTQCVQDDTVEIKNEYYYPKPSYPLPTYLPPIYPTTPQTVFPPATARISA